MKELLLSIATVCALSAVGEVLLPEGRFHHFAKLLCGLWVIYLVTKTLSGAGEFSLTGDSLWEFSPTEMSAEAAQKEQEAKILVEEVRRLNEYIKDTYGVEAGVRVDDTGQVQSVQLGGQVSEETAASIAADMGIDRGNVTCEN